MELLAVVTITLKLDRDSAFREWKDLRILYQANGAITLAALQGGMESGLPSVAIGVDLRQFGDQAGDVLLVETSARLFCAAADALRARFPELSA